MLIKIELNKFSNVRDQTRLLQKKDRMILFLIERTTPHIVNKMYVHGKTINNNFDYDCWKEFIIWSGYFNHCFVPL